MTESREEARERRRVVAAKVHADVSREDIVRKALLVATHCAGQEYGERHALGAAADEIINAAMASMHEISEERLGGYNDAVDVVRRLLAEMEPE